MTELERQQVAKLIVATAAYYQRPITSEVVSMMADDLKDLPFERVCEAFQTVRRDPKTKFMPLPAQIREIADPVINPEVEARDAIEKIKLAISSYGYPHGTEAKEFIGEVGWRVVEGLGGWTRVCESDFTHNPAMIAQARTRALDLIKFSNQFEKQEYPQITGPMLKLLVKGMP